MKFRSAVVFVVLAACTTGGHYTPKTSPAEVTPAVRPSPIGGPKTISVLGAAVPWVSITATQPSAPTIPPGVRPCTGEDLTVSLPGMGAATGGQMAGSLRLRNTGNRTCFLTGSPTIQLLDGAGGLLQIDENHFPTRFGPDKPKPPTWPLLLVEPGHDANVFVVSANWCGPHVASWQITLSDGSHETLTRGWMMGLCDSPGHGSGLSVGPFEPPQTRPNWPLVPMIFTDPLRAEAGSDLNYVVALMNVPKHSFSFPSTCPPYEQRIERSGRQVANDRLVLNCSVVGPIPGETAVNFAMTIHIPSSLHGDYTLVWKLDPPYGYDTKVPLIVE